MTAVRKPGIRKRVWTNAPSSTDTAELARDAQAAVDEVDGKMMIVTFKNRVWAPPMSIDTGGRCPDAVISGSAQQVGFPAHAFFGSLGLAWDFTNSQVRLLSAGSLVTGTAYNVSFLLFFGGG